MFIVTFILTLMVSKAAHRRLKIFSWSRVHWVAAVLMLLFGSYVVYASLQSPDWSVAWTVAAVLGPLWAGYMVYEERRSFERITRVRKALFPDGTS